MADLGITQSLWIATTPKTNYPQLSKNIQVDVAVVGGGIAGLGTAFFLSQAGFKVAVLESNRIITGTTGYTTGKLTSLHTLIYHYLSQKFGIEVAKLYGQGQEQAIEETAKIIQKYHIDCDFYRVPAYTYTMIPDNVEKIRKEYETALKSGLPASLSIPSDLPFKIVAAVKFDNQVQFHPRKFLLSLANIITKQGGQIFEQSEVLEIKGEEPCQIKTARALLQAKNVVIATNFPILNQDFFKTRLFLHHSCAIALQANKTPKGMYINIEEPTFSLRKQPVGQKELIVVTGHEDQKEENPTLSCQQDLANLAQEKLGVKSIDYRWATMDQDSFDRLPLVGKVAKNSPNIFVITGFGGWGMSNGILSGLIIADLIQKRDNPYKELFDPSRERTKMQVEEGKVVEKNGKKTAVYKDEKGQTHTLSAICTHMGCIVAFNPKDQTWDCPCHGSRFDIEGKVIHGPALKNLPKLTSA